MDGIQLTEYMGGIFRLLIGEPLTAAQLLALTPDQQAMYLIVKIKSSNQPVLTGANVNHITAPLPDAVQTVCAGLSEDQIAAISSMLLHERYGWIRVVDEQAFTRKSDNVITLLVALVVYNEGGWIRIEGVDEVLYKPDARPI